MSFYLFGATEMDPDLGQHYWWRRIRNDMGGKSQGG